MDSEQLLDTSPESSPASTPDEERCLAAPKSAKSDSHRWPAVLWSLTPCTLLLVSVVQVLLFLCADVPLSRLLRWEPTRRAQVWRLASYILLHRGAAHLALNVLLQLLLAAPLAREQGGARYGVVYAVGGVAGALGAALLQPQPLVGASAGVYALLISHLAHLYLNISRLQYRKYRVFSVCVLAASDIAFCCVHARTASISVGAHGAGGVSGALLGLVAYRGDSRRYVRAAAGLLTGMLFTGAVLALALLPDSFFTT